MNPDTNNTNDREDTPQITPETQQPATPATSGKVQPFQQPVGSSVIDDSKQGIQKKSKSRKTVYITVGLVIVLLLAGGSFVSNRLNLLGNTTKGTLPGSIWSFKTQSVAQLRPLVDNDTTYFTDGARIVAIKTDTGKKEWLSTFHAELSTAPSSIGNSIYVADQFNIYGLDKQTGKHNLSYKVQDLGPQSSLGDLVSGDKYLYIDYVTQPPSTSTAGNTSITATSNQNKISARDPQNGNEVWAIPFKETVSGYAYSTGKLFVLSEDGYLHVLDGKTGQEVWKFNEQLTDANNVIVFKGDNVIINSTDKKISTTRALNKDTGVQVWQASNSSIGVESAVDSSNSLFAGCNNQICALDAQTGKQLWQISNSLYITLKYNDGKSLYVYVYGNGITDPNNRYLEILDSSNGQVKHKVGGDLGSYDYNQAHITNDGPRLVITSLTKNSSAVTGNINVVDKQTFIQALSAN